MTRSIFDPEGGETERSGSQNLGPAAENLSHMPPDVVDGNVEDEESEADVDVESAAADEAIRPGVESLEGEAAKTDPDSPDARSDRANEEDVSGRSDEAVE